MNIKFKPKKNLFWSVLFLGFYIILVSDSINKYEDLCVRLPRWEFDRLHCFQEHPFWFVVVSLVWIGGGIYYMLDSFEYRNTNKS